MTVTVWPAAPEHAGRDDLEPAELRATGSRDVVRLLLPRGHAPEPPAGYTLRHKVIDGVRVYVATPSPWIAGMD